MSTRHDNHDNRDIRDNHDNRDRGREAAGDSENARAAKSQRPAGGAAMEGKAVRPTFGSLPEVLIGLTCSFVGVRDLDEARYTSKIVEVQARRFMPFWIGVASETEAEGSLPAHIKPTLNEALRAFQRFRAAHPEGRVLEIRLSDHEAHMTGWKTGSHYYRVPGKIGGGKYYGLQLDGNDRWEGLRILTPEVDVLYGKGSRYSVVVKERVTSIGWGAFSWCTGLALVTLPEELTNIGKGAFHRCAGLTSIAFPKQLTNIGAGAFYGCTGLIFVTFPKGLISIGSSAFCLCSGLTSVVLPKGLTSVKKYAFGECTGLTSVTFPGGLNNIGEGAFVYCRGLTSVTFPEGLTSIEYYAFIGCTRLTTVGLPRSVHVDSDAFPDGCKVVSIGGGKATPQMIPLGIRAPYYFQHCIGPYFVLPHDRLVQKRFEKPTRNEENKLTAGMSGTDLGCFRWFS